LSHSRSSAEEVSLCWGFNQIPQRMIIGMSRADELTQM